MGLQSLDPAGCAARHPTARHHSAGVGNPAPGPCRRRGRGRLGRAHRPGGRRVRRGRPGPEPRPHDRRRGDRSGGRHHDGSGRLRARDRLPGGDGPGPVPARGPRGKGLRHHRRGDLHQRRRQPGAALWHDARVDPRAGSGAGGRDGDLLPQPPDQEQRRLRSQAAVHRVGGHPGHRDPGCVPPAAAAGVSADRLAGRGPV